MSPGRHQAWPVTDGVLELGDFPAERGEVVAGARLAWQAHGTLNGARDNVIVYPCSYTASHEDLAWLIGPDRVLDPARWFIVVPDMFSNGQSSGAADTPGYPAVVTMADNVRAQHQLLTSHLGVARVAAAYGFSMGGGGHQREQPLPRRLGRRNAGDNRPSPSAAQRDGHVLPGGR